MNVAETAALLDQARGVLFSRSNVGNPFLVPVSTLAIRYALLARNVLADVSSLLGTLDELRDVQGLPRGHWLPVSTRLVPCGDCALIVSGAPSQILERDHNLSITNFGLGRLLLTVLPSDLPTEPLLHWLDAPASTANWCGDILHHAQFGDPLGWDDLWVYDHWSVRSTNRWVKATAASKPDGPIFARSEHLNSPTSHYLLRASRGVIRGLHELPSNFQSRRFSLAMLHRAGNEFGFSFKRDDANALTLDCPHLPRQERKLLEALGPVDSSELGLTTRLPMHARAAVQDILSNLGLNAYSTRS